MPAKAEQMLRTGCQRAVQIERIGGAAAASSLSLMEGNDDCRAAIPFHQPSRHNANHAGVPIFPGDDQHAVPQTGRIRVQRTASLCKNSLLGLLPFCVDLCQTRRNAGGLFFIAAKQQFQ